MKWYEIKNKAEKAEIWIYEFIGKEFWSDSGITAKDFQKELAQIKASEIDLHINSPGGEVFDGNAIYNLIKQHPAKVTTYIDGLAASIASVIALAGDTVYMAENALFMIHSPWSFTVGNEEDHEKTLEMLKQVGGSIARTYISKTGKPEDEIRQMMKDETWMGAEQALEAGFVDDISGQIDMAACARFKPIIAKLGFKNVPEAISEKQSPTRKDAEKALRNAGYSRSQSRNILAKGISDGLRNAEIEDPEPATNPPRNVDVEPEKPKKDRVSDLLIRAEVMAPGN